MGQSKGIVGAAMTASLGCCNRGRKSSRQNKVPRLLAACFLPTFTSDCSATLTLRTDSCGVVAVDWPGPYGAPTSIFPPPRRVRRPRLHRAMHAKLQGGGWVLRAFPTDSAVVRGWERMFNGVESAMCSSTPSPPFASLPARDKVKEARRHRYTSECTPRLSQRATHILCCSRNDSLAHCL